MSDGGRMSSVEGLYGLNSNRGNETVGADASDLPPPPSWQQSSRPQPFFFCAPGWTTVDANVSCSSGSIGAVRPSAPATASIGGASGLSRIDGAGSDTSVLTWSAQPSGLPQHAAFFLASAASRPAASKLNGTT